jgi:ribosomal-protein-alanine N-acetyltransferase
MEKETSVRLMTEADIPAIKNIDLDAFATLWSTELWQHELHNSLAKYLVLLHDKHIVAYAGYWLVAGEAQISRVAVAKALRGQGLGKFITRELIQHAWNEKAEAVTLEVRKGNLAAQKVYLDCGFINSGIRPHYYEDNNEDAVIMWLYRKGDKDEQGQSINSGNRK